MHRFEGTDDANYDELYSEDDWCMDLFVQDVFGDAVDATADLDNVLSDVKRIALNEEDEAYHLPERRQSVSSLILAKYHAEERSKGLSTTDQTQFPTSSAEVQSPPRSPQPQLEIQSSSSQGQITVEQPNFSALEELATQAVAGLPQTSSNSIPTNVSGENQRRDVEGSPVMVLQDHTVTEQGASSVRSNNTALRSETPITSDFYDAHQHANLPVAASLASSTHHTHTESQGGQSSTSCFRISDPSGRVLHKHQHAELEIDYHANIDFGLYETWPQLKCMGEQQFRKVFRHVRVAGDGNCYWRCISMHLHGTQDNYQQIKQDVVDWYYKCANHRVFAQTLWDTLGGSQPYIDAADETYRHTLEGQLLGLLSEEGDTCWTTEYLSRLAAVALHLPIYTWISHRAKNAKQLTYQLVQGPIMEELPFSPALASKACHVKYDGKNHFWYLARQEDVGKGRYTRSNSKRGRKK